MKNQKLIKVLAASLAVLMLVGFLPIFAFSASVDYVTGNDDYYKVISKNDWDLAPGIVESEIVLNNDASTRRQVAHVVEVDINNPYTKVIPSSKGMTPTPGNYGVQVMSQQAKYAEEHGYGNVVAAMNISLSWYNSDYYKEHPELVGEPLGYLVLDGKMYVNSQGQTSGAQTCVVINFDEKDGEARPADMPKIEIRSTATAITGWEEQVIPANFGFLVQNGKNLYSENHDADSASRSFVGIKEDGTFVMVMNDGRQSPYSAGFNSYEMAEFMLSLGCVTAVNGDGGGSSVFLSQRPGEELKINCSPSDGSERETTHGILVISTAPATGEFVRATLTTENDYYTPNSSVQVQAIGSDLVGTAAEIPEDAAYQLADDSFGSIDETGLFVSNGKTGTAVVQMVYNGEVVGSKEINIVMPDSFVFDQKNMVVPFGKTVQLPVTAKYGAREVVLKDGDVTFTFSDDGIGTINGFTFTAAGEESAVTKAVLTGVIGDCTAQTNISLGRGSEIINDFENEDLSGWTSYSGYLKYGPKGPNGNILKDPSKPATVDNYWYNGQNELGSLEIVDSETGKVRNGNHALAMNLDFSQIYETGYHRRVIKFPKVSLKDAVSVGFWIYVPEEAFAAELELAFSSFQSIYDNGKLMPIDEDGWRYVTVDVSAITEQNWDGFGIQVDDRAGNNYDYVTQPNLNGKYTFYIDDLTIDYSTAVEDRENPVFSNPVVVVGDDATSPLDGQTINVNAVTLEATVSDDTTKGNAAGIDESTAKAYIDGVEVPSVCRNGRMQISNVTLADGVHTVKFSVCDKAGNYGSIVRKIDVQANSELSTIKVVPHDPTLDRIKIGSLYYTDIVATDIEKVKSVEVDLDLTNTSTWELDHMNVADGFTAAYEIIDTAENIARITLTRISDSADTGECVIASLPARTWESHITECEGYEDQTPEVLWSRGIIWSKSLSVHTDRGIVTFVDENTSTFGAADIEVMTEIFFTNYSRKSNPGAEEYIASHTSWHIHSAQSVPDVAATCTKDGYTGRTYCNECQSVVDWGTAVPATGHSFVTEGNIKTCTACNKSYSADGLTGWQVLADETYYFGTYSEIVDGQYTIDGHTYTFANSKLIDGAWENDGVGLTCWWAGEQLFNRWFTIGNNTYHFTGIYADTGFSRIAINTNVGSRYHMFDENGVFCDDFNGIYIFENNTYYLKDGIANVHGLVEYNGDYYYINSSYVAIKNTGYRLTDSMTNGLLPAGTYYFDAEGKMIQIKNGLVKDSNGDIRYYVDDVPQYAGLVQDSDGNYYYINSTLKAVKSTSYTISAAKANGLLPAGTYKFGADGKMIQKNGLVKDDDGEIRYYLNNIPQYAGLVQDDDGNYYYINSTLKAVKSTSYAINDSKTNDLLPAGIYHFGADGKMINPPSTEPDPKPDEKNGLIFEENGDICFYENGIAQYKGLVQDDDGNYYYINSTLKAVKSTAYTISSAKTNGLLPPGTYNFDADGKMIQKNGLVKDNDGEIRYYINNIPQYAGLVQDDDGSYYYINSTLKAIKNSAYTIGAAKTNGLLPAGTYRFGADGKMVQGKNGLVKDENGDIRYFINNTPQYIGLVQDDDGNYYYINSTLKAVKNTAYTIGAAKTNGLLPAGTYNFGADGKMIA